MSRRYIDADNMKMVLMCTEKELTIEDIVNYIDNNICNDVIPLERVEQIRAEIEKRVTPLIWKQKCVDEILAIIDKAIKEQNR